MNGAMEKHGVLVKSRFAQACSLFASEASTEGIS
jgi:hypothetical protein